MLYCIILCHTILYKTATLHYVTLYKVISIHLYYFCLCIYLSIYLSSGYHSMSGAHKVATHPQGRGGGGGEGYHIVAGAVGLAKVRLYACMSVRLPLMHVCMYI